jgi:hypothetical protein
MYSFDNGEWDSVMAFYSASAVKEPGISFTTHFEALSSAFRDLLDRAESYPKKALAKLALERKVQVFRKELKERP